MPVFGIAAFAITILLVKGNQSDFSYKQFDTLLGGYSNKAAQNFFDTHFPQGSSALEAVDASERAGATCALHQGGNKSFDPSEYVCQFKVLHSFIESTWTTYIYIDKDSQNIKRIVIVNSDNAL